ncbi:uncharacterized protein BDZ83DRAFT_603486 [Colletotrichum acutatum]|uniref:Uncharacterized protein n=1 Tax=Glomerella acutata TaxID=27357 RepID=A0AAD8XMU2_GLOAC|nr:uncharacterized protein BDZ83DRAFT_603486 [Colletotrichum acutatum]KAK1730203.1 hypothetical protein BDZ83DRAFT_603486 [Colletotrichum acutatum]
MCSSPHHGLPTPPLRLSLKALVPCLTDTYPLTFALVFDEVASNSWRGRPGTFKSRLNAKRAG